MNDPRSTPGAAPLQPDNDDHPLPKLGHGTGKDFVARLDLAKAQNRVLAMVVSETTMGLHPQMMALERHEAYEKEWNAKADPNVAIMPDDGEIYECCGFITHFDATTGLGYVTPDNGLPNASLHKSTLKASGFHAAPIGARIMCQIVEKPDGIHVYRIHRIDARCAAPLSELPRGEQYLAEPESEWVTATIMRFDFVRGHGYLTVPSQSVMVYCQVETVRRCGFFEMMPAHDVQIRWGQTARGPTVAELRMIEDFPP